MSGAARGLLVPARTPVPHPHRLKTHGGWTYTTLESGTYLWHSPHGYTYLRDHHGTLDVSTATGPPRRERPRP
jgi:hypothetical protein